MAKTLNQALANIRLTTKKVSGKNTLAYFIVASMVNKKGNT